MTRKTLITLIVIIIIIVMVVLLYQVAIEELQNRSSAPYPLAEVNIEDTVTPDPSQTSMMPSVVTNVSPNFIIEPPVHSRLPMYEFSPSPAMTEDFANKIAQKLDVPVISNVEDKTLGKVITAAQGQKSLTIYATKGEINYTNSLTESAKLGAVSESELENLKLEAEKFVNSLELQNAAFQYESHQYVTTGTGHAALSEQNISSNFLQLTYITKVEGLSVVDKNSDLTPNTITVWITGTGEVVKLYYQAAGKIGQSFGNYELLDLNEIKADLQTDNTKAKLVNGTYPIGDQIESINITKARAAYLSVDNYLVPVYILEANVRVAGNRSGIGYLLLEAIKK